jgi:hypothetical protein
MLSGSTKIEKISKKIQIIFCIIFISLIDNSNSYAETKVKGFIRQYGLYTGDESKFLLNSNIKIISTSNDHIGFAGSISPIQLRPNKNTWDIIPECYVFIKKADLGKITIGKHMSSSDILVVDAGTFAVGDGFFIGDTNYSTEFSPSLVDSFQLQKQKYNFKFSYLSPVISDKLYFGISHTPSKDLSQARMIYSDTFKNTIDFKASVGVTNTKASAGFNIQYLGVIAGGSVGRDLYTAGLGYSIGPFKTSITHVNSPEIQNTVFGAQYNLKKNIIPFIQFGRSTIDSNKSSNNIMLGVQILM